MTEREFWENVDIRSADECWEWKRSKNTRGYGHLWMDGRYKLAHRVALELASHSCLLPGSKSLHRCDNPPCCNPAHLFPGTSARNTQDMVSKGRHSHGARHYTRLHPERVGRGETHSQSKLMDWQIPYIKAMVLAGLPQRDVARAHGVGEAQVSRIVNGKNWSHL